MDIPFPRIQTARRAWLPTPAPHHLLIVLLVLALSWLTILPVIRMIIGSFASVEAASAGEFTLANYVRVYSDPITYELYFNSLVFALGSCLLSFTLDTTLAWIIERTDTPFRRFFFVVSLVPLIVPGIVMTIAWLFLLSPRIGLINSVLKSAFGLDAPPFDIYSVAGMIWVEGLATSPLVFLLMSAALKSMDPSLEESASTNGAGTGQTLRRVTLPLMLPTIASVMLIIFIRALEAFEVPAIVGLPAKIFVFSSRIYVALARAPADPGVGGALATSLVVLSVLGIMLYRKLTSQSDRFATISGKAFRPRAVALGRWRFATLAILIAYSFLIIVLPLAVLIWMSLLPFFAPPSLQILERLTFKNYQDMATFANAVTAVRNSLLLAAGASVLAILFSAILSWISIRSRIPGRQALDVLAFLPIAVPGIVLGAAFVALYVRTPIYGTLWVLLFAYVTRFLPYGIRAASGSLLQLRQELEEAAEVSGASWLMRFRRIVLPLLRPGLLAGGLYIFIVSIRELSSSALLTGPNSTVLAVLVLELQEAGRYTAVAALSVMMVAVMAVLVAILMKVGGRIGIQT